MQVLLSWSKEASGEVAQLLRSWIPRVIQQLKPWMSSLDIPSGSSWPAAVSKALDRTDACIVCVTPATINSPWIHFEAGAAMKQLDRARVCPYLLGVNANDLQGPLSYFQAEEATQAGTLSMMRMLNDALGDSCLDPEILEDTFRRFWPDLESGLREIELDDSKRPMKGQVDLLEEILDGVRRIERGPARVKTFAWTPMDPTLAGTVNQEAPLVEIADGYSPAILGGDFYVGSERRLPED